MTAADDHPGIVGTPAPAALALRWPDEAATAAFAARLAAAPELRRAFIALHGDLGAGKTTLVRHLLRACGVAGRIKSPTYAVVEPHEAADAAGTWQAWHFDFYRFDDPREWEDAGFRDIFAATGLKIAEWPEKAEGVLPVPDLDISITSDADEVRHVRVSASTPAGRALLRHAADDGASPHEPPAP